MVKDCYEKILRDWDTLADDNDSELEENLATLTAQLVETFRDLQDDCDLEIFVENLWNSSTLQKLVHVVQVTKSHCIRSHILTTFEVLLVTKPGISLSRVVPTLIWPALMKLALEVENDILTEHRHLALDIIIHTLKIKHFTVTVCQAPEWGQLIADAVKLLESKEGNRKLVLKRQKSAATILSSISRHKEGRQLIFGAKILERLHGFLLTLQDENAHDTVVHKIGQTILRCVPFRDLFSLADTHSAFFYLPFQHSNQSNCTGDDGSSETSEDSDWEEGNDGSDEKRKIKMEPPQNLFRSAEELEQYRRLFSLQLDEYEVDELDYISQYVIGNWCRQEIYEYFARKTRSIYGFSLIPYPDWINATGSIVDEPLHTKDKNVCRNKLMKTVNQILNPDSYHPQVVYDLDSLLLNTEQTHFIYMKDVEEISKKHSRADIPLEFESRFESGNLRRAMRVGMFEYDLVMNADVNSRDRQQWFYFRVSGGVLSSNTYTFNILNFEKQRTLFNQGMQPVLFSVKRYLSTGQPIWERKGTSICYYRNGFRHGKDQSYWTLSFDVRFPYDNDVVYLAYHYPYTYSQLMTDVVTWKKSCCLPNIDRLRVRTLCHSPCGNPVPLLLVDFKGDIKSCCIFMSRVHPCESNSSWTMRGLVTGALQNPTQSDEKQHPLIILPMLNVDGTVHGCSRTELSNEDLNRRWLSPNLRRHPTIYHAKGLLEFVCCVLKAKPPVLCDMHGHSRRFNVFAYGCKSSESWCKTDHPGIEALDEHNSDSLPLFLKLLQSELPFFDVSQSSFQIEKSRESTARIVAWRHFGVTCSYTLECSIAGATQHPLKGMQHYSTFSYLQVGEALCRVIKHI